MNRGSIGGVPVMVAMSFCLALGVLATELPEKTERLQKLGPIEVGKPVPWFAAYEVRGDKQLYNLTNVLNHESSPKVALVFFTTFCKPCREGLLMLRDARSELAKARVKVLLVDVGEEPEEVARYLEELGLDGFIAIADYYSVIARRYGLSVVRDGVELLEVPKTVVFDRKGILQDILGKEGRDYVSALVGNAEVVVAQTSPVPPLASDPMK